VCIWVSQGSGWSTDCDAFGPEGAQDCVSEKLPCDAAAAGSRASLKGARS